MVNGLTQDGLTSAEEAAATVEDAWFGFDYLLVKNDAWTRLADYYATLGL